MSQVAWEMLVSSSIYEFQAQTQMRLPKTVNENPRVASRVNVTEKGSLPHEWNVTQGIRCLTRECYRLGTCAGVNCFSPGLVSSRTSWIGVRRCVGDLDQVQVA